MILNLTVNNLIIKFNLNLNKHNNLTVNNNNLLTGEIIKMCIFRGPYVGAQGRAWHSEHFVCTVCDGDLSQVRLSSGYYKLVTGLFYQNYVKYDMCRTFNLLFNADG